jgi:hypothetical protein
MLTCIDTCRIDSNDSKGKSEPGVDQGDFDHSSLTMEHRRLFSSNTPATIEGTIES